MDDRRGFFSTLAHAFYDFGFYREVVTGGIRGGVVYLVKLALLVSAVGVVILALYQQHHFRKVVLPRIEAEVKPAFAGSPALTWKEGKLTAEGTVPFKASAEFDSSLLSSPLQSSDARDTRLTVVVDTRDEPDTSPLAEEVGHTILFTATRLYSALDGKVKYQGEYGKRFNGQHVPAGEVHRLLFPEPRFELSALVTPFIMVAVPLFFVLAVAAVVVAGIGLALVPEGRHLGLSGAWAVAAHAMTGAAAMMLVVLGGLLFLTGSEENARKLSWLMWAVPLAAAVAVTWAALKASTGAEGADSFGPPSGGSRRKDDDDLLPPDRI